MGAAFDMYPAHLPLSLSSRLFAGVVTMLSGPPLSVLALSNAGSTDCGSSAKILPAPMDHIVLCRS